MSEKSTENSTGDLVKTLKERLVTLQRQCANLEEETLFKKIDDLDLNDSLKEKIRTCINVAKAAMANGIRYSQKWLFESNIPTNTKAYEHVHVHHMMPVPSPSTISRYLRQLKPTYGFQTGIFEMLKAKAPVTNILEKEVFVSIQVQIMSLDSTRQDLRKLEFPYCVKEALRRIEHLCTANVVSNVERIQSIKQTELAMELITEFVFCEVDRRGAKKKRLNRIQEMQLLEVLGDYFAFSHSSSLGGDVARNTVFMSLFPYTFAEERSQFLIKLISIAICTNNIPLLSATGVLMQQVGCTSKFSAEIAKGLVNDFFVLLPECSCKLRELPSKAPLFTANFLTALTEIYFVSDDDIMKPPRSLLDILTEWVCQNSSLCYAALISNLLHSLPSGGIPMPSVTPFVGLFRWCTFAPLYAEEDSDLYSKIHLSALESLLEVQTYCPNTAQRNVISAQHLSSLVSTYNDNLDRVLTKQFIEFELNLVQCSLNRCNPECSSSLAMRLSLERLSQFLQVALHTNSVYGNKQELINRLKTLPKSRLLQITLSKHKEII